MTSAQVTAALQAIQADIDSIITDIGELLGDALTTEDCERPLSGGLDGIPGANWDSECAGVGAVTGEITDEGTLEP